MATDKQINGIVANLPGVQAFVREVAERCGQEANALFAPHDNPGGHEVYVAHGVGQYGVDSEVGFRGPAPGALEMGHVARDGSWVPGIRVLRRATGG